MDANITDCQTRLVGGIPYFIGRQYRNRYRIPSFCASSTAFALEFTSSFERIADTWASTVFSEMKSFSEISLFWFPLCNSLSISIWRFVSCAGFDLVLSRGPRGMFFAPLDFIFLLSKSAVAVNPDSFSERIELL